MSPNRLQSLVFIGTPCSFQGVEGQHCCYLINNQDTLIISPLFRKIYHNYSGKYITIIMENISQ